MKNMKKLISLMLTLIMVAGCMAIPMTASAAITSNVEENYSSLASSSNIAASLAGSSIPWAVDTQAAYTYESVDRGDDNGTALKWNVSNANASTWGANIISLPTVLSNEEPAGTQVWFSMDFAISDANMAHDVILFPTVLDANYVGVKLMEIIAGNPTPTVGTTTLYGQTGVAGPVVAGNGWHTLEVCQEKVNATDNTITLSIYIDGKEIHTRESITPHNYRPMGKLYLYGGHASVAGSSDSFSIDNMKNFKCVAGDYTPSVPDIPEVPAEYEVVKTISTAAEWAAEIDNAYIPDSCFADVPGSYGKAASDTVVRMTYENPTIGSYMSTVQVRTPLNVVLTPDEKRDVIVSFDLLNGDANYNKRIYYKRTGYAYHEGFEHPHNNIYDVIPVNQWNHYDILYKENNEELYINGILFSTKYRSGTITEINPIWSERQNVVAPAPSIVTEIDNFTIAYSPVEESMDRITAPQKIFRNFDFTGVVNGAGNYMLSNGIGGNTYFSADMVFSGVGSDAIVDGFAGKAASDKVMKFYSEENIWKGATVRTNTDTNNPNISAPKSQTSAIWGSKEIEPGSTIRGGVSILLDENSFTGTEATKRVTVRPYGVVGETSVYTEIDLQFTEQDIRIKSNMTGTDSVVVAPKAALNQWHRVDYVLNVADGKGGMNTVDFYLNGVLMNDEPIEVGYDYPAENGVAATTPVVQADFAVMCAGTAAFYVDDFTYEYIPADYDGTLDALNKGVALPSTADGSVVLANGNIVLMDAATSAVTADGLNAKLCPNTPVSLVDASGAAVTSGLAAGNYAYLSRGVLPGIFYKVTDLDVAIDGKEVTATLPYAADEDVVMIVALYKDADQFATCISDTAADGKLSVTVSDDDATSYKVFLWKNEAWMMPFYAAAEGALN